MLPVYESDTEGEAASAVAYFTAAVRRYGGSIFVGCMGGAVCTLQAPFLATRDVQHPDPARRDYGVGGREKAWGDLRP
jgi:hypothetical protein